MRSSTRGTTYKYRCETEIPELKSKIEYLEDIIVALRKQLNDNNQVDPILFDMLMVRYTKYDEALKEIKYVSNPATTAWVIAESVLK